MKKPKLLYISDFFVSIPAFDSQMHALCNYHTKNFDVTLLVLCNFKDIFASKKPDTKYSLIKVFKISKAFIPFINKLTAYLCFSKKPFYEADIIHCRSHVSAVFALNMLKKLKITKPIIADIRGINEEFLKINSFGANFYFNHAQKLEAEVFKHANYFFFVSQNMKEYFKEKYNLQLKNSEVLPPIVDEKYFYKSEDYRNKIRKDLHIEDKFVYIYAGSTIVWQNVDQIILRFSEAVKNNDHLFLLLILKETKYMEDFIKNQNMDTKNIKIISLPYTQVGQYLNAGDAGLIIRDNLLMNKVASPMKINEYQACGLKIVDKLSEIGNIKFYNDKFNYIPLKKIIEKQQEIYNQLKK